IASVRLNFSASQVQLRLGYIYRNYRPQL
ncbi:hypothetical protein WJX77_004066, partial [Trebouxia sp. C0004]